MAGLGSFSEIFFSKVVLLVRSIIIVWRKTGPFIKLFFTSQRLVQLFVVYDIKKTSLRSITTEKENYLPKKQKEFDIFLLNMTKQNSFLHSQCYCEMSGQDFQSVRQKYFGNIKYFLNVVVMI